MNIAILMGRLTKKPECRYTTGAEPMSVCRFSIAVDKFSHGEKSADFFNIVAFGRTADNCERYLDKGSQVLIQGSIAPGQYEKDGQIVRYTDIKAEKVEFIGKANKNDENECLTPSRTNENIGSPQENTKSEFMAIPEDEIPF